MGNKSRKADIGSPRLVSWDSAKLLNEFAESWLGALREKIEAAE